MRLHVLPLFLVLALGCSAAKTEDDVLNTVPEFRLIERSGKELTREDLKGKIWIASFIFTRCCESCPQVTANLVKLQSDFEKYPDVVLVSFSVDPEHDNIEILNTYAELKGAKPDRWLLATGDKEAIYRLCKETFFQAVHETEGKDRRPGNEVTHGSRLGVVDRQGRLRGLYEARDTDKEGNPISQLDQLKKKVQSLARERP